MFKNQLITAKLRAEKDEEGSLLALSYRTTPLQVSLPWQPD